MVAFVGFMSLELSDINDLKQKNRNPIHVGSLPYAIAKKLELKNSNVYLSLDSYNHIKKKHKDISDFDLLLFPFVIQHGLLAVERDKPTIIMCSYLEPHMGKRYLASLKIAANKTEIWALSMYRAKAHQTKVILQRATMIKSHD